MPDRPSPGVLRRDRSRGAAGRAPSLAIGAFMVRGHGLTVPAARALARSVAVALAAAGLRGARMDTIDLRLPASVIREGGAVDHAAIAHAVSLWSGHAGRPRPGAQAGEPQPGSTGDGHG